MGLLLFGQVALHSSTKLQSLFTSFAEGEGTVIDLTGRVAIVTGSARGIGKEIANQLAAAGADVVVADIEFDLARETAENIKAEHGTKALALRVNVTSQANVEQVVAETVGTLGGLDILVNNAGVQSYVNFIDMTLEEWLRVLDTNLNSVFLCCKAVWPIMRQQGSGRIINLSSMSARTGGQASPPNYTTSKAGVIGLTKSLARDMGSVGVTVNALAPGIIDTEMIAHWTDEQREDWRGRIPLARLGTPRDVGNAVVFLASDLASYITGVVLDINGGYVMP